MSERRKTARRPVRLEVLFAVTDIESSYASVVEAVGTIVDISSEGFGILTSYPLKRGHVITIRKGKREDIPDFGIVRWSGMENNQVRAGLSFS